MGVIVARPWAWSIVNMALNMDASRAMMQLYERMDVKTVGSVCVNPRGW